MDATLCLRMSRKANNAPVNTGAGCDPSVNGKGGLMLKLAFCGNDCNVCPRYIATLSGDEEQLKEAALMWKRAGWRDAVLSPEEIVCHGCSSVSWCRYGIRECALEKGVDNCGKCQDYPCEKLLKAFERTESYAKNIKESFSKEDYECFQKAFFLKKESLDRVNREYLSQRKGT